jgi:hypothetical protein
MNRVDPLREGSGECEALVRFDAGEKQEFRRSSEKIAREIISLLKTLSLLRHSLKLRLYSEFRQKRFRKTERDATRAPLVFGILKFSYSSRAPTMLMCACAPMPHANSEPLVERLPGDSSELTLPSSFQ